ncbi:BT1 family protein [Leishmania donovani]|uniref:BT1 family protein n=1 Tax=Leishmania donovani TaxID=5661 RepID=A0A504XCG6_LEIDO|nr:BT1 family protein [Leishmania donovani]
MSYKEAAPKREKDAAGAAAVPEAAAAGNDGKYIHPEAASLFARCPWVRRVPVFGEAVEGYGLKFIVALGASNLLCKGVADQILYGQTYAMMIDRYGIDVARYQRLSSISTMGWSIKAFTAMLCDGFAFLGYTKRWYMFISCVGGGAFALIYGLLPAKEASANVACAFIFLSSWGKANVDILSQGHYSRLMRQNPKPGPALVSWMWFCIMIGSLIATVMNGPLADAGKPQISIFVSAALQAITCVFYLFNWYGEKKNRVLRSEDALFILEETRKERERLGLEGVNNGTAGAQHGGAAKGKRSPQRSHSDEGVEGAVRDALNDGQRDNGELPPVPCLFGLFEANTEVISKNWKIFVYSVVMTCAVIAMLCANILADTLGLLVACVVVSTICCAASFWALPLVIAKANVFAYLDKAVSIRVSGPLNAFYLNTYGCPGNLPNFTYTFYNTVAGVINTIVGMITVTLFNFLFAKHGYRLTFIVTTIMQVLAALFDIIMVKRWNLYIGIPDHAMYIWGDAVVGEIVYMLGFMPQIVLLSRLCPRGSESVVYALMAGFARLGRTTAASLGAILLEYGLPVFKTQDDGIILLPKARICDDIDIDGKVVRQAVDKQVAAAPLPSSDSDAVMNAEPLHGNKADEREAARGEAVQGKRAGASEK